MRVMIASAACKSRERFSVNPTSGFVSSWRCGVCLAAALADAGRRLTTGGSSSRGRASRQAATRWRSSPELDGSRPRGAQQPVSSSADLTRKSDRHGAGIKINLSLHKLYVITYNIRMSRPRSRRPKRLNSSHYDLFWHTTNWMLPDAVLADIWRVDRGNLRARRVRLGIGPPRWRVMKDSANPVFRAALALERVKPARFVGPRLAGPSRSSSAIARTIGR